MAGKVGKLIKFILLGILFLIIILAILFKFKGEAIIAAAAETAGTKALNVNVSIDDLDLKLLSGEGTINGLSIANPAGFNNPYLMQMKEGNVKVNTKTLLDDTVVIDRIYLDNLHVTFEQKGLTSNIKVITDSLKKEEAQPDEQEEKPSEKKVVISDLKIVNTKLTIKLLPIPGQVDNVNITLPEIHMTDVGKGEKMSFEDVVELIFVKISEAIAKAGSGVIPEDLLGPLNKSLDQAVDVLSGAGEQVLKSGTDILEGGTDAGKAVGEKATEAGKAITEGASKALEDIGGIFKKKEKTEETEE